MVATTSHGAAVCRMFTRRKAGMVTLQGKSCGPYLSASGVWFSQRGAIQMFGLYLFTFCTLVVKIQRDRSYEKAKNKIAIWLNVRVDIIHKRLITIIIIIFYYYY